MVVENLCWLGLRPEHDKTRKPWTDALIVCLVLPDSYWS